MRVISGTARGRRLKSVPGDTTRPILDRIKENLFNIVGASVVESRWLDLFAGTGGVGIEALSRGASFCLFTELDRVALKTISENLEITRLKEGAQVLKADALKMLGEQNRRWEPFEYIFVAPPQYKGIWVKVLNLLDVSSGWLVPDGQVIIQIDPREYEELALQTLDLVDERVYGKTMLRFYEKPPA